MNKICLILVFFCTACITKKEIAKTGVEQIQFGSGGGFTGEYITYTLFQDGEIKKGEKIVNKISLKETLSRYAEAKSLSAYTFNDPQNMTYFIGILMKNDTNNISWGIESQEINKETQNLYKKLIQSTTTN